MSHIHRTNLSEAILGLDRLLKKKKMRGRLVLDEFQEITAVDKAGANSLEAEFRTVVQLAGCLSFAFLNCQGVTAKFGVSQPSGSLSLKRGETLAKTEQLELARPYKVIILWAYHPE